MSEDHPATSATPLEGLPHYRAAASECSQTAPPRHVLSVVIAAYNVGPYIGECIGSVIGDGLLARYVDIIVVVDGATDDTDQVATRFACEHPELAIQIVRQKNRGLSSARNVGVSLVKTPYVTFLDGDDFWLPEYLSTILQLIDTSRYDVIEYDALLVDSDARPRQELHISSGPRMQLADVTKDDFLKSFKSFIWARVFDTTLVRSCPFPEGLRFEDTHTTPWIYSKSRKIVSIGKPLIAYRQREGSILRTPSIDDVMSLNIAIRRAQQRFTRTSQNFWLEVTLRIYQQACARIIVLPIRLWRPGIQVAKYGFWIKPDRRTRITRRLLINHTLFYIFLLYLKRNLIDRLIK